MCHIGGILIASLNLCYSLFLCLTDVKCVKSIALSKVNYVPLNWIRYVPFPNKTCHRAVQGFSHSNLESLAVLLSYLTICHLSVDISSNLKGITLCMEHWDSFKSATSFSFM